MKQSAWIRAGLAGSFLLLVLSGWMAGPGYTPSRVIAAVPAAPTAAPAGPAVVRFTASSINKKAPTDAIPQIDLRLGGAGYPGCLDAPEEPTLDLKTDNLDLTGIGVITTCGWKAGETVKVTLMDPQGKLYTREVKAAPARQKKSVNEVDIFYQPGADAPEGKYRFTLQGDTAIVKAKIVFNRLKGAKLYALPVDPFQPLLGATGGQQRLRLNGFLPGEPVRLLAYRFEGTLMKFYGFQDYTADRRGQIIVETDLPEIGKDTEMNFYAYGRDTHFVPLERFSADGYSKTILFDMDLYCPGAQAPRLTGPADIRLAAGLEKLDIHQQPGFGSRVVTQVPAETQMRTYGYPKCIDHAYWWKVSVTKPILFGWAAESFLGKYLIEGKK